MLKDKSPVKSFKQALRKKLLDTITRNITSNIFILVVILIN